MSEDYSTWKSCEFYGHNFVDSLDESDKPTGERYCTDCPERYRVDD